MKIHSVWGVRKYSPDEPELITAWDEFSVDSNPEGYEEDWRKGVESWGDDLLAYRHIVFHASHKNIVKAFEAPEVEAEIV